MKCYRCYAEMESVADCGLIMGPESSGTRGEIRYICDICWESLEHWVAERLIAPTPQPRSRWEGANMYMCPHCGVVFRRKSKDGLIPEHDEVGVEPSTPCPGIGQNPRNPESDGRLLWNGKSNPNYYRTVLEKGKDHA